MATWYRAHNTAMIKYVFSGDGGLYVPGRWNHKGRKVIYCSDSIALCTLEWLAHNGLSVSGYSYYKFEIDIPDKLIKEFSVNDLPKGWNREPAINVTRDFAEKHLFNQNTYLAISVPSVMVPEEFNLVINPLHKDMKAITSKINLLGKYTSPTRK
ncbi:TPA: RES domain-containing protein [Legionella pneumophila]|uniref:RES family NAD+ phosphorylase n=1 Tax=Legionella pneumophila TaxID=446 RepID=UPI001375126A|nr:RES family NAD+ phosphorylase [Legionella pneumophila]MDW8982684.1 RES family NAD+ phosphorylase [Legionella pneumophila]MDW8994745.1 RES family NAD+ phosphorylase [Legionella pneumophila]MDW9176998.1 RES family NAD+ phosphorylase [Legionella pneumophila]HAT2139551.1 RES domain-containing protein [Legionella pneumophila]HAT8752911.1 RES domain-containing protein [Legionella pneumophila]